MIIKVGDKIRYTPSSAWDGAVVTKIDDDNNTIWVFHPKLGQGAMYPHQVIPFELTDEELAAAYREGRNKMFDARNQLKARGYSLRGISRDGKDVEIFKLDKVTI